MCLISQDFYTQYNEILKIIHNARIMSQDVSRQYNQRLPGACNRSPGSKLLSITTQLHCGGQLGGRV